MALEHLCSDIDSFLNNTSLEGLLNQDALRIFRDPSLIDGANILVLYGNSNPILYKFLYHVLSVTHVRTTETLCGDVTIEYARSNHHIELMMTEQHMGFVKSLAQNQNIRNKKFIFLVKNCSPTNMHTQQRFKRMFEKLAQNAIFVFAVKNLAYLSQDIINMSTTINCKFTKEKIASFCRETYFVDVFDFCGKDLCDQYNNDLISIILAVKNNIAKTKMELAFERFLDQISKEKNGVGTVSLCKEFAHKVYHLTIPFPLMAKYILQALPATTKDAVKFAIVQSATECDHTGAFSKKNILVYERFLLEVASLI